MLDNHPLLVAFIVAVMAPLLAEVPIGVRVPVAVLEVLLGAVVGPHVLGLIHPSPLLSSMQFTGTVALLFMARMEIDFEKIRGRPLSLALGGWAASAAVAFAAVGLLHVIPGVGAPMMVTIALTTTGLGTLLPVLKDGGQLETLFGRLVLAAGTIGEVSPIVAASLILSSRYSTWQEFRFLILFLALVAAVAAAGIGARPSKLIALLSRTMHSSTQLPVRLPLLLLAALVAVSEEFGFEGIFGAFAVGLIVGLATRGEAGEPFRVKIDAICFGWFMPFFFVGTGVQWDLGVLTRDVSSMLLMPTFLVLFLLARGLPVFLYRRHIPRPQLLPVALFNSVASLGLGPVNSIEVPRPRGRSTGMP